MEWALRREARALVKAQLTPVKVALYRQRQAVRRLERSMAPRPRSAAPALPVGKEEAILRWMFDEGSRAAHRA